MAAAGIKLWVLTGDKVETAINIGYSCQLLRPGMRVAQISADDSEDLMTQLEDELQLRDGRSETSEVPVNRGPLDGPGGHSGVIAPDQAGGQLDTRALVVDGAALTVILADDQLRDLLLELGQTCVTVIACRVSPLQKAQLVRLVKQGVSPTPVTLAVGDGANDVGMIQEAHVGIGISGKEGLQATNSSDFAVAQFSFLKRLLLVHGRWNYRRMCKVLRSVHLNTFITSIQC